MENYTEKWTHGGGAGHPLFCVLKEGTTPADKSSGGLLQGEGSSLPPCELGTERVLASGHRLCQLFNSWKCERIELCETEQNGL